MTLPQMHERMGNKETFSWSHKGVLTGSQHVCSPADKTIVFPGYCTGGKNNKTRTHLRKVQESPGTQRRMFSAIFNTFLFPPAIPSLWFFVGTSHQVPIKHNRHFNFTVLISPGLVQTAPYTSIHVHFSGTSKIYMTTIKNQLSINSHNHNHYS